MTRKPITAKERDAIVADVRALAEKHSISAHQVRKFMLLSARESRAENKFPNALELAPAVAE